MLDWPNGRGVLRETGQGEATLRTKLIELDESALPLAFVNVGRSPTPGAASVVRRRQVGTPCSSPTRMVGGATSDGGDADEAGRREEREARLRDLRDASKTSWPLTGAFTPELGTLSRGSERGS